MLRIGLMITAAAIAISPNVASATTYSFQDTEISALSPSAVSYSFSLDTATAVADASGTTFNHVVIDENGTLTSGNSVEALFGTNLSSPLFFWVDTSLQPFYSGAGPGIAFNTGTFAIANGETDGEGTLIISASPVSATPEPATWSLLLTGTALAAAASRSRRSRVGSHIGA